MSTGDDSRKGGDNHDDASAPTIAEPVASAAPTPSPMKERGPISAADTAVATRSQAMAAVQAQQEASAAADEEDSDPLLGSTLLGRYEVTAKIGQGGMGAVYEATHTLIGKRVAIKVLLDKYAQKDPIVARLEQEARLASSIGHEHIIDITDFGKTNDGKTFVVMEFLEGEALGKTISREGQLPEERIVHIAQQAASALGAAHKKGVIHRDVKPDNVFLLKRRGADFVKVVDFGISKAVRPDDDEGHSPRLTQTGMVLGTPLYMSPEQARGDDELDHRIDIYAVGVIMYEMATGEVPFRGNNYLSILSQVINDDPVPPRDIRPDLSEELESVIMKALAKDRDYRYQSMEELEEDLGVLAAVDGMTTGRARITAERYRRRKKRSPMRTMLWIAGITVIIAGVAFTVNLLLSGSSGDNGEEKDTAMAAALVPDAGAPKVTVSLDAAPAEPALEVVTIPIGSKPKGATIYHGDRVIGDAPCVFRYGKVNEKITLVAELEGYHDSKITINPYFDKSGTFRMRKVKKGDVRKRIKKTKVKDPKDTPKIPKDKPKDDTAGGELTGDPFKKKPK